ncbi:hypothetical protein JCM10207_002154 [Rhodosporidiobolus poonsookiae]
MGLSQQKVGKLVERSQSAEETEEILLAYSFSKWSNGGNQHQVLRKLHLLTLYLRAVDLGPKLRDHYQAFAIAASLTKANTGPVIVVPVTPLGLEAWNAARRPSKSTFKRAFSRSTLDVVTGPLGTGSSENSDAELPADGAAAPPPRRPLLRTHLSSQHLPRVSGEEQGSGNGGGFARLLGGSRSRSGTMTAVLVTPGTEQAEQTRRTAGAGSGLGTGLLSAPPLYDGRDLAQYVEDTIELRAAARPYDPEQDALPGYA